MKRRPFGWTGVPVPVVGQGTWNLERDENFLQAVLNQLVEAEILYLQAVRQV